MEPVHLCYNVFGRSQQTIFILYDKFTKTKVEGVLLNDYYIHKVKIYHNGQLVNINRRYFEYEEKKNEWSPNTRIIFKDILIDMSHETMEVEVRLGKYNLTTIIKKSVNKNNVEYLDVSFKGINQNRIGGNIVKRYGGLIGDIGQKDIFIEMEKFQDTMEINVEIDKRFLSGKLEKRLTYDCILLPIKKLIEPNSINNYIY